ncbi:hypothetical protein D3C73_1079980 [compost metagenome]
MQGHRRADAEAEDGGRHQEGDHAQADDQVLTDDRAGAAAQAHGERQVRQVVRHQRHIGRFQRHVRPGRAHGHADRGRGHGRGVVDPVADHGDLGLGAQALDRLDLVVGHQVAPGLGQADLSGDGLGRLLMVARDHDHALDAQTAQPLQRIARGGSRRVQQADDAQIAVALPHDHQRASLITQPVHGRRRRRGEGGHAVGAEHLGLADQNGLAVQLGRDALAGQTVQTGSGLDRDGAQAFGAVAGDGGGQRVVAEALDRHGDRQQRRLVHAVDRDNVGDARAALGQGAGLVEGDDLDRA